MDSCLAAWIKPQVFTSTTLASSAEVRSQPDAVRRAASSSESTSLRAQPSVTRLTDREFWGVCGSGPPGRGEPEREGTARAYAVSGAARSLLAGPGLAGLGLPARASRPGLTGPG